MDKLHTSKNEEVSGIPPFTRGVILSPFVWKVFTFDVVTNNNVKINIY